MFFIEIPASKRYGSSHIGDIHWIAKLLNIQKLSLDGVCFEFDVSSAAQAHALLMYDHNELVNMTDKQKNIFNKMKEIRTLTNWNTLRFVIGYNKSGIWSSNHCIRRHWEISFRYFLTRTDFLKNLKQHQNHLYFLPIF